MGYDAGGRLAGISDQSRTYLSSLQYQGKGNALSSMTLGNATTQSFIINDRLQMTSQNLSKGSEVIQKYDYGYGQIDQNGDLDATKNNGQLAQVISHIGTAKQWTQKFSYDSLGRLSEANEYRGDTNALSYKQKFDFDRFGNLYRKQSSNPAAGQATPLPFTPIEEADISKSNNRFTTNTQYDDAGNVTQDAKFRNLNYSYDANGRMFKTSNTQNTNQANSVYDSAGQRVAQQIDNVWTFFIYDAMGKMVAEYGGVPAIDEGGIKYVLQDWQSSSRAILGNTGNVQARMDYTAFGEEIQSGVGQRTTTQGFNTNNNLTQKYALTERDKATGLDHTWFRKNENKAGRWTSPDPYNGSMSLGNPQSFNRYSYVENQPTNFIDPSGLNAIAFFYPTNCRLVYNPLWETESEKYVTVCDQGVHIMNIGGGSSGVTVTGGGGGGGRQPRRCSIQWNLEDGWGNLPDGYVRKSSTKKNHQFGTNGTTRTIRDIGQEWIKTSNLNIRAGDISLVNGKDTPDHTEHQKGNQFDIGLFRNDGKNQGGFSYKDEKTYDRETTQKLIDILEKDPRVTSIIFNDPKIKGSKVRRDSTGVHDNHLHVEIDDDCEN